LKNLSAQAKAYILSTIVIGFGLIAWMLSKLDWGNYGLYLLAVLGAVTQTLKLEGPTKRTNYNIAWFVYGFAFIAFGPAAAIFVIFISHLEEWVWHKYPWYIQSFNIGAHVIPVFLAGLIFETAHQGTGFFDSNYALGMAVASLVFVFGNHFMVGVVVRLARGQSFAESGVFEYFNFFLDFTLLSMGGVTALVWFDNPFAALLNIPPLYLLYNSIRVPALKRQLEELKTINTPLELETSGD
jgi:hypothetical protein